jgi:Tol biopolymer transport system component
MSPLGGGERLLAAFPASATPISWSPDGRWLAAVRHAAGIHLVPTSGGEPIAATSPAPGAWEVSPAFSPDGRHLAYASCVGDPPPACAVHVLPLGPDGGPRGPSRRLTDERDWIQGIDWTRDGRAVLYADGGLWRVPAEGGAPPERVGLAGDGVSHVGAARGADRLVLTRLRWGPDVYRLAPGGSPAPLIVSTSADIYPEYSPDGSRIAFASDRAGEALDIWLAAADGTSPARLTRGPARGSSSPRWSPDGKAIAFDVQGHDGRYDVWTIGVDGSSLRQLTRDPANDFMPSWSRDGRFVYFASNRTGRNEVWRAPASGGTEERVTGEGGCASQEGLDGRTLYYLRSWGSDALLARPTAGGPERILVPCVDQRSFAVGPDGLYHVQCSEDGTPEGTRRVLHLLDPATGRDRAIGAFESQWTGGLSVSPDGRSVIYSSGALAKDLLMIEDFR